MQSTTEEAARWQRETVGGVPPAWIGLRVPYRTATPTRCIWYVRRKRNLKGWSLMGRFLKRVVFKAIAVLVWLIALAVLARTVVWHNSQESTLIVLFTAFVVTVCIYRA